MTPQLIENIITILGKMKDLKRSGWLKRRVETPESDAEHSFSVAMLAWLLAPAELDRCRCLELALTHDLVEIYSGDYTPVDNISPEEKHQRELQAAHRLAAELQQPRLLELFSEYEAKETKESIFINGLDKLDNVITAAWYDDRQRAPNPLLPEFSNYAKRRITALPDSETAQAILNYICNERKSHEQD